jgi:hypothetical protein
MIFAAIASNDLDAYHEPTTADIAYERVSVLQTPQTAQKLLASLSCIRGEGIPQDDLEDFRPHSCYKRVIGMSREEKETILLSD